MSDVEDPSSLGDATYRQALRAELDRRLAELATTSDQAFGRLGVGDAVLVSVLFMLLPAMLVWLCR
jgi:hypothetical protein